MAATATAARHPARYTRSLMPVFADIIQRNNENTLPQYRIRSVLDPMGGTGRIGELRELGFDGRIAMNELEPEWAEQAPGWVEVHVGDAAAMDWVEDGEFDAIVTSPTYGNRMADHHNARDASRRYTYTHALGRALDDANTGKLQWGQEYREAHEAIWGECVRVLRPGGLLVLNIKDHIRKGALQLVPHWHAQVINGDGRCKLIERHSIPTPGMRNGANNRLRVDHEDVFVFRKAAP